MRRQSLPEISHKPLDLLKQIQSDHLLSVFQFQRFDLKQ